MTVNTISMASLMSRYKETYKVLRIVVILSFVGIAFELIFAYISSSIIIYTDVVHWVVDTALEIISMTTFYIISKVYKRIRWNVFALESLMILIVILTVFSFYIILLINTINFYTETLFEPTTSNPFLALVTTTGGILTFLIYIIERRAYLKLKTEVLKVDMTHAIADMIIAAATSLGIILTTLTKNYIIELTVVLLVLFAAIQTLINLVKDSLKSILGFEVDSHLKIMLMSRLSRLDRDKVRIGDVELKKMGTFYVAKIEVYLDPNVTIGEAHKLRKIINIICREVSELIYHVDVIFYPKKRFEKHRRREKYNKLY